MTRQVRIRLNTKNGASRLLGCAVGLALVMAQPMAAYAGSLASSIERGAMRGLGRFVGRNPERFAVRSVERAGGRQVARVGKVPTESLPMRKSAGTAAEKVWIDRGIQRVRVSKLPKTAEIHGTGDFVKGSATEMAVGLKKLRDMEPVITRGEGASSRYWAEIDRRAGLDYAGGKQRIYDAFYGQTAIRVEKSGETYVVTNGNHRLWLARKMGIAELPVRVIEKK